jgi:hypothetical protein
MLLPYQQRVVEERKSLSEKIIKLTAFIQGSIFQKLNVTDQLDLLLQRQYMKQYYEVLVRRTALFDPQNIKIFKEDI